MGKGNEFFKNGLERFNTDIVLMLNNEEIQLNGKFNDFNINFKLVFDEDWFVGIACSLVKTEEVTFDFIPYQKILKRRSKNRKKIEKKFQQSLDFVKGELFFKAPKNENEHYIQFNDGKDLILNVVEDVVLESDSNMLKIKSALRTKDEKFMRKIIIFFTAK